MNQNIIFILENEFQNVRSEIQVLKCGPFCFGINVLKEIPWTISNKDVPLKQILQNYQ